MNNYLINLFGGIALAGAALLGGCDSKGSDLEGRVNEQTEVVQNDRASHVAKDGEGLWRIGQMYGKSVAELQQINGIKNADEIDKNQRIYLEAVKVGAAKKAKKFRVPKITKTERKIGGKNSMGKFSYMSVYDKEIENAVSELNKKHGRNLDSDVVRAMIHIETGGLKYRDKVKWDNAFDYDPMQIANKGDCALGILSRKEDRSWMIGDFSFLKKMKHTPRGKGAWDYSKSNMTGKASIRGGVGWLFHYGAQRDERIVESGAVKTYVVKSGDSFDGIAGKNGSRVETLKKYNPKVIPRKIRPGQKLKIRDARREDYISGWDSWKVAVGEYNGGGNKNYVKEVYGVLKEMKEARK